MIGSIARRAAVTGALAAAGSLGALTLYFHPPFGLPPKVAAAGLLALALAALAFGGRRRALLALYLAALAATAALWISLEPSAAAPFRTELARLPLARIDGDRIEVANVRNFDWRSEQDYDARWETRTYALSQLRSVDLFETYWMGPAIAHTIVSFGFADGRHLAFSVEVRRTQGEEYAALPGFFRVFQLAYVAADERDLIGLRHVRPEDTYVFRLRVDMPRARALLVEYLRRASDLAARPRFYNSVAANCATEIFSMVRAVGFDPPFDWRILANGYLPELAYEEGLLDARVPLDELRRLGRIEPRYRDTTDSVAYSAMLRAGVPDPAVQPEKK